MAVDDLRVLAEEGNFLSLDIEGDGNAPRQSPVEICCIEFVRGSLATVNHWLVNPGRPMSAFVQEFHGITDAMIENKPSFADIEEDVRKLLEGANIVAYRAAEDLAMLRTVMPDVDFLPAAVIDAQRLARNLLPGLERYRLSNVCETLGIAVPTAQENRRSGVHTAGTDAMLAAEVFLDLARRVPATAKTARHIARMSLVTMSPRQEARRREELSALGIATTGWRP